MPFQEHRRVWERPSRPGWGSPPGTPAWEVKPWRPLATYWLLGIIGATYVLQWVTILVDRRPGPALAWPGVGGPVGWLSYHDFLFTVGTDWMYRPWSPFTSTFAHSPTSILHLLLNGLFLWAFGPHVERIVGRRRFVALFLVGGALSGIVQAHVASWMRTGSWWDIHSLALGASGALMVLLGILVVLTPRMRITMVLYFLPVTLQMWVFGLVFVVMDVLGVLTPDNVGHFAHLSGLALGLGYGYWAKTDLRRRGLRVVDPGSAPTSPWMRR